MKVDDFFYVSKRKMQQSFRSNYITNHQKDSWNCFSWQNLKKKRTLSKTNRKQDMGATKLLILEGSLFLSASFWDVEKSLILQLLSFDRTSIDKATEYIMVNGFSPMTLSPISNIHCKCSISTERIWFFSTRHDQNQKKNKVLSQVDFHACFGKFFPSQGCMTKTSIEVYGLVSKC